LRWSSILDLLAEVELQDLSLAHLEDLRNTMRKRGLAEKTIRNTIDGSLRALVRDAEQEDIAVSFPFGKVRWPEKIVPGPSPFTEGERDQILEYFRGKRWKAGGFNDTRPHYPYFAFLYTLFFTGMRPSELVALRVGSVNLRARTLQSNGRVILDPRPRLKRSARGERSDLHAAMQKFSNRSLSSRRALMTISSKTFGAIRSSPPTFTICFAMHNARSRSRRCAISTRRKTPTSHTR
jgi:integrase